MKLTMDSNNDDMFSLKVRSNNNASGSLITRSPLIRRRKPSSVEYNLVLLGELGVGKTAIAVRYVTNRYLHEYDPFLERCYERITVLDGENIQVKMWDTVQKDWNQFVDPADGFIVVYSITSIQSFETAQHIIRSVRCSTSQNTKPIPILLLGNKIELCLGREVDHAKGLNLANTYTCSFNEISTAENIDVSCSIDDFLKTIQGSLRMSLQGRRQSNAMSTIKTLLSRIK